MINIILAIDDQDEILGDFFTDCLLDLESFENHNITLTAIRSNSLNDLTISLKVPSNGKFVFLAYSHGSENELLANSSPYISDTLNADLFKESFFYTCSCSTARKLGQLLIDKECSSYIGYKEKFEVWDFNRPPFIECANLGYKLFIQGENIESIIKKMEEKYDEHISNYNNDFFGAASLLANKKALVALGDLTHSINRIIN